MWGARGGWYGCGVIFTFLYASRRNNPKIHAHLSVSGAAAGRHQPSTRPSPGSCIPAHTTTRRYVRIPGNAAQMRTQTRCPALEGRQDHPNTRTSPSPRSHDDAATRRYTRIPGSMTGIRAQTRHPAPAHRHDHPNTGAFPGSCTQIRGTYHSECLDKHIPLPGIHRQRMRTRQQQRHATGTIDSHG